MVKKKDGSTEDKILDAAIEEFAELGYAGARVDSIAARAKINKAMIYYYFKSKEKLYERILTDITTGIFSQIQEASGNGEEPLEQFYSIINRYMDMLSQIDRRIPRIMMREIASGGTFFRKVAVPNLVVPIMTLVEPIISEGIKRGDIKELNPYMTLLQIIGGIVFFNILRIPLEGSQLEEVVFSGDFLEEFRRNLLTITSSGIEPAGGE